MQAIVKQYRTRLGTLCLVCAALSVPLAFVQETAIALTLWMLFFLAGLALPYLPLLQANAKLKALKKSHGWQGSGCRMVDTGASAFALPKPIGPVDPAGTAGALPCCPWRCPVCPGA